MLCISISSLLCSSTDCLSSSQYSHDSKTRLEDSGLVERFPNFLLNLHFMRERSFRHWGRISHWNNRLGRGITEDCESLDRKLHRSWRCRRLHEKGHVCGHALLGNEAELILLQAYQALKVTGHLCLLCFGFFLFAHDSLDLFFGLLGSEPHGDRSALPRSAPSPPHAQAARLAVHALLRRAPAHCDASVEWR